MMVSSCKYVPGPNVISFKALLQERGLPLLRRQKVAKENDDRNQRKQ